MSLVDSIFHNSKKFVRVCVVGAALTVSLAGQHVQADPPYLITDSSFETPDIPNGTVVQATIQGWDGTVNLYDGAVGGSRPSSGSSGQQYIDIDAGTRVISTNILVGPGSNETIEWHDNMAYGRVSGLAQSFYRVGLLDSNGTEVFSQQYNRSATSITNWRKVTLDVAALNLPPSTYTLFFESLNPIIPSYDALIDDISINNLPVDPVPPPEPVYHREVAFDTIIDDRLGYAVANHPDYVFVSAAYDDDPNNSGKVYVYEKLPSGSLLLHTTLKPTDLASNNQFGASIAVDGNTVMIGARNQTTPGATFMNGAVYVYTWNSAGEFTQDQKLIATDTDRVAGFGMSIALNDDMAVIGAERSFENGLVYSGNAFVFAKENGTWQQLTELTNHSPSSHSMFGWSVAINPDKTTIAVGEPRSSAHITKGGRVHLYKWVNNQWAIAKVFFPADQSAYKYFGQSVSLDGTTLAVGAPSDAANLGAVYLYDVNSPNALQEKLTPGDTSIYTAANFGSSLQFANGLLWIGSETRHATGALYSYLKGVSNWEMQAVYQDPLSVTQDKFGRTFSVNGDTVVVGSPESDDAGNLSGSFTYIQLNP